ncbi:Uu.00g069860.m01.CDS01 [Anthostomella pinea]|uniref:Uu.00g069860.m01.CDS01 n=1 Tax=Anthostomella pinea TaxID=933095 RepID=A0AAI8YNQ7_9PEZI|nr:Uu.00g069860.m01.CDS01 [Anthostomella pinea]
MFSSAFVRIAGEASSGPSTWSATCERVSHLPQPSIRGVMDSPVWTQRELTLATDTKEKPYICRCGSAFARRDLLTRHQRISHDAQDTASGSPDAPLSEEGQQAGADAESAGDSLISPSRSMSTDQGIQQSPYLASSRAFGNSHTAASQPYGQLPPGQDFYNHGQEYSGFDSYTGYSNYSATGSLPAEWGSPYFDPGAEQDMVDPSLRPSIAGPSSPATGDNFSPHSYNSWMSAHQRWGN